MADLRFPHPPMSADAGAPPVHQVPAPLTAAAPTAPTAVRHGAPAARVPWAAPKRRSPREGLARFGPLLAVAAGLVLVGALGWQQWGSNWWTNRTQDQLLEEFASDTPTFTDSAGRGLASLAAVEPTEGADPSPAMAAPAAAVAGPAPRATPQGAIARITSEKIELDWVVVDGVSVADLRKGPGWMPGTAPIGTAGNTVISGHRTTYGAPFRHLDQLVPGDRITVETLDGTKAVYEVRDTYIVKPRDVWVAEPTDGARLTLTTCHPVGSDRERMVVQAEMVEGPAAAAAVPAANWQRSTP